MSERSATVTDHPAVDRVLDDLGVRVLVNRIIDPQRTRPILVITTGTRAPGDQLDPQRIAAGVGEQVEVAVVGTGRLTYTLRDGLPDETDVFGDAARTYPPGTAWHTRPELAPLRYARPHTDLHRLDGSHRRRPRRPACRYRPTTPPPPTPRPASAPTLRIDAPPAPCRAPAARSTPPPPPARVTPAPLLRAPAAATPRPRPGHWADPGHPSGPPPPGAARPLRVRTRRTPVAPAARPMPPRATPGYPTAAVGRPDRGRRPRPGPPPALQQRHPSRAGDIDPPPGCCPAARRRRPAPPGRHHRGRRRAARRAASWAWPRACPAHPCTEVPAGLPNKPGLIGPTRTWRHSSYCSAQRCPPGRRHPRGRRLRRGHPRQGADPGHLTGDRRPTGDRQGRGVLDGTKGAALSAHPGRRRRRRVAPGIDPNDSSTRVSLAGQVIIGGLVARFQPDHPATDPAEPIATSYQPGYLVLAQITHVGRRWATGLLRRQVESASPPTTATTTCARCSKLTTSSPSS